MANIMVLKYILRYKTTGLTRGLVNHKILCSVFYYAHQTVLLLPTLQWKTITLQNNTFSSLPPRTTCREGLQQSSSRGELPGCLLACVCSKCQGCKHLLQVNLGTVSINALLIKVQARAHIPALAASLQLLQLYHLSCMFLQHLSCHGQTKAKQQPGFPPTGDMPQLEQCMEQNAI